MAPKITRKLPYKLLTIFFLIALFITCIIVAVGHGSWSFQRWRMRDGHTLSWEVTLNHIYADVVCDGRSSFYTTCHSVFEKTDGPISAVAEMICGLANESLTTEPGAMTDIKIIAKSCEDMRQLDDYSIATFSLLCCAAAFLFMSFICLLKWCYVSFDENRFRWYGFSLLFIVGDLVLLCISLIIYGIGLGDIGNNFYYPDRTSETVNDSLVEPIGTSSRCAGFYTIVVVLFLHLLLLALYVVWVPRGMKVPKKTPQKMATKAPKTAKKTDKKKPAKLPKKDKDIEKQPLLSDEDVEEVVPEKKVFWAFMPDVFQPALGGDDFFGQQNLYEDEITITTQQEQVVTGYGTVTTHYVGDPTTVATTYVEQPTQYTQQQYQYPVMPGQQYPTLY